MKRDSKAFRQRFQRWKNGEKVYDNGRALPEFEDGTEDDYTYNMPTMREVVVTPNGSHIAPISSDDMLFNLEQAIDARRDKDRRDAYTLQRNMNRAQEAGAKAIGLSLATPAVAAGISTIAPIVAPALPHITVGALGGEVVNEGMKKTLGYTWGQGINQLTKGIVPEWLGDFTNPGYAASMLAKPISGMLNAGSNLASRLIQNNIPYNPTHFYRGVGKEAILDAERSGILRGKNFESPYFGLGKPEWHQGYVIEGSHGSGVDWVSADDPTKIIGSGTRGLNKPGSLPVEAFPQYNGSTQVPADGFTYWKKYPIIGWRQKQFKLPSKMPNIVRTVQDNGKIRLSLPSHTENNPRQLVLEPQGDNKFYVHIRTWDGDHLPANLTNEEKQQFPYVKFNPKLNLRKPNIRPKLANQEVRLNLGTDLGKNKITFDNQMSRDQLYNLAESKGEIYNIPNLTISANTNGLNALESEGLAARRAAADFQEFDVMPRMRQMGHPNVNDFQYTPDIGDIRLLNVPKASTKVGGWNDGFTTYLVKANKSNPLDEIAVHEFEHQQRRNMGQSLVKLSNPNTTVVQKARQLLEVVNGEPIVNYGYTPQEKEILNSAYKFSKDFLKQHPNIEQIAEIGATNRQMRYALSKRFGGIFGKELDDVIGKLDVEDIERLLEEGNSYSRSFLQSINEEISALKANSDMSHYAASKKVWDVYRPAIQRALMKVGMGAGVAYTGAKKTQRNKPLKTNK